MSHAHSTAGAGTARRSRTARLGNIFWMSLGGVPFMSESHSLGLVIEAVEASERLCARKRVPMLQGPDNRPAESRSHGLTHALNRVVHLLGLHVSRVSVMQQTARTAAEALQTAMSAYQSLWYDGTGKTVGTGTLLSVLEDAQAFDGVYSNLADDSSRCIFDWYIRFRVAYALVGEDAYNLFPAEESRASYAARCAALAPASWWTGSSMRRSCTCWSPTW